MTTRQGVDFSDPGVLAAANEQLEGRTPETILGWAVDTFATDLTLACSFSGPTGMVLLDMLMKIDRSIDVFYLDTDFLFPETYQLRDTCAERYGITPVGYRTAISTSQQVKLHGPSLWERDPDLCCEIRKVEPNKRALEGKRAWISGLRRDQAKTRRSIDIAAWDAQFSLVKISPLAAWTEGDVWSYILQNDVPYNVLHDRGYPSIGCTNCTKAVTPGEDPRSGRWQGFDKVECGIHIATVDVQQTS